MLFDSNGFINPMEYDFKINILDTDDLFNKDEALAKGNLFKSLYVPYKSYKEGSIKVSNQMEKDMLDLQTILFAINDLNLYLDLHPDDYSMFNTFKSYVKDFKTKKKEYTKKYGPIDLFDEMDKFEWVSSVFPWEDGN